MEWIAVSERLPEHGVSTCIVAVANDEGPFSDVAAYVSPERALPSGWYQIYDATPYAMGDITHWMPLPKPPA